MSNIPFPNREDRSLSMREQVIERLLELDPTKRRSYLETMKDFALLQSLQVIIELRAQRYAEDYGREMFDAGMDYGREQVIEQVNLTMRNLSEGM